MGTDSQLSDTIPAGGENVLEEAYLELPYIPDFLLSEIVFYFVPSRDKATAVYHELLGNSAKNWSTYFTKKGWTFLHGDARKRGVDAADGPWRVVDGQTRLDLLAPGRFIAPRPQFRFRPDGEAIPILSLEKRRPINPWKPNYIRALEFIKRFEWPHSVSRRVSAAIWEIEECGEVAGSTSWINAEAVLVDSDSEDTRATLEAVFFNRPEDFPLGSEVYLRVLGRLGSDGFARLLQLAKHPVTRKRCIVARTLGAHRSGPSIVTLLMLLEDEDPDVRSTALRSLGRVGVDATSDPQNLVRGYLESPEISHRVWAAAALLAGGDTAQRKYLIQLIKDERRPLSDLGDMGDVLVDLDIFDAVPFLIQRLKDDRREIAMDAAETLQRLTGEEVEFSAEQGSEQRRLAMRVYTRWWEDRKRERGPRAKGKKRRR